MIIDTDVLVWYLNCNKKAWIAIDEAYPFSISVVTWAELIHGVHDKQKLRQVRDMVSGLSIRIIQIDESISFRAMQMVEDFCLSDSLHYPDALIAATAIEYHEPLLTGNVKHFRCIPHLELETFRP